jgi:hypothetical protein
VHNSKSNRKKTTKQENINREEGEENGEKLQISFPEKPH